MINRLKQYKDPHLAFQIRNNDSWRGFQIPEFPVSIP